MSINYYNPDIDDASDLAEVLDLQAVVVLKCNGRYANVNDVKFLDIESDMSERDVMTFECPECGKNHKSLILG